MKRISIHAHKTGVAVAADPVLVGSFDSRCSVGELGGELTFLVYDVWDLVAVSRKLPYP